VPSRRPILSQPTNRLPMTRTSPLTASPSPSAQGRDAGLTAVELPDVLQFMQLLWAVVHGLEKISKRMSSTIGVTGPQRLVLRVVGLLPGLSAGDLATILHIHPSTLTGILQRLVAQGLLRRIDDPSDRRRAILRLTPSGTRANAVKRGTVESAVAAALAQVAIGERDATRRVLERLAEKLDVAVGEPVPRRVEAPAPPAASRRTRIRRATAKDRLRDD
jgi:MarR family transcriptional regulator, organic hydroperoxide resistance regulator